MGFTQLWSSLLQTFGMAGTLLVLGLFGVGCLVWIGMALGVLGIYRRSRIMEQYLIELRDRLGTQTRRQQVQRLQRDKGRNKSDPGD